MEQIAVYFSDEGIPATGLSPIVNIIERNGAVRVTNGACKELANGFYVYNFNEYNSDKQYLYLFDGGSTLGDGDRYKPGNNEMDSYSFKQSWGRTVAATTPYDDKGVKIKLDNLEKLIGKNQPKSEKIDLTPILNRLKSIEEKKIEFPTIEIPKVDTEGLREELSLRIEEVKNSIKPGISPQEIRQVIDEKEAEGVFAQIINDTTQEEEMAQSIFNKIIQDAKQEKQDKAHLKKFIKSLSTKTK